MLLPVCPRCVLKKSNHPAGIKKKHTHSGALAESAKGKALVSYHTPAFNGQKVADYMGIGVPVVTPTGVETSGCVLYRHRDFDSINAISHLPLGQIPGSGVTQSGAHAAQHATLCDIEGKSGDGPHYFFESDTEIQRKIKDGIYIPLPLCSQCGLRPWRPGQPCPACAAP